MKFKRAFCRIAAALVAILVIAAPVASVSAIINYDTLKFFADNNILYYDPTIRIKCSYILDDGDALNTLMAYFMNLGYNQDSAAAIVGSLKAESGLDPKKLQGGDIVDDNFVAYTAGNKTFSGGFGLAQWTSAGRVQNLQNFANNKNQPVTSLSLQAEFIAYELANSYNYSPEQANQNSLEENTWYILKYYEAPASVIYATHDGKYYNDFVPQSLSDLNPNTTPAAYKSYQTRLGYAKEALGVVVGSSVGSNINTATSDGSQVTIIGDSITVGSEKAILELLPKADIIAQNGKQFAGTKEDNPTGQQIIESKIADATLRDIVVIALGTNNSNLTTEQINKIVTTIGDQHSIIFVNNYDDVDTGKYERNNKLLAAAAEEYSGYVSIANWQKAVTDAEAANPGTSYIKHEDSYAVHPTAAGQELFAQTIANAVNADAQLLNTCTISGAISDLSQALPFLNGFIQYINSTAHTSFPLQSTVTANEIIFQIGHGYESCLGAADCGQCTAVSGWFVSRHTSLTYGGGNGINVVANLLSKNSGNQVNKPLFARNGEFPDSLAIFSRSGATEYGHTGLVLGRDSEGNIITLETNTDDKGGLSVRVTSPQFFAEKNAMFYPLYDVDLSGLGS